jgi:uncharacterized Zn finger protein
VAADLSCPRCGEAEDLAGERREASIWIRCGRCAHEWPRDTDVCPRCGRRSIADRREPLLQKARGTQQSIVGFRIVQECWACGYRTD